MPWLFFTTNILFIFFHVFTFFATFTSLNPHVFQIFISSIITEEFDFPRFRSLRITTLLVLTVRTELQSVSTHTFTVLIRNSLPFNTAGCGCTFLLTLKEKKQKTDYIR